MIPKIIHFCWMSNDPFPEKIQNCINSWHKYLPDYEFIHWNYERFPRGKSKWVDEAFDSKKYAFCADYIRLYALYNYGGIYLDTDVEVLKSFEDLLHLPYFLGRENSPGGIEAAVIGVEKGSEWVKVCLEHYANRHFAIGIGKFDIIELPRVMLNNLTNRFKIEDINNLSEFNYDREIISRFPVDWFSPKNWESGELTVTNNTYTIHHFAGTWKKRKSLTEQIRLLLAKIYYKILK